MTGMLEDRRINMVMVPDAIEAALYRNVFCVFLGVVEQVIQDMSFTVLDTEYSFHIEVEDTPTVPPKQTELPATSARRNAPTFFSNSKLERIFF